MSAGLFGPLRDWASNSDTVRRWRTQRYELFERLCNLRPDDRILDVGAGWGAALERFNTVNPIVALDLNPTESDWLAAPNVTVVQGMPRTFRSATPNSTLRSRTP